LLNEIGVTQITLPLPFRLNHVQCFLAEGKDGWTVIDAGLNSRTTRDIWKPVIEKYAIHDIIITHCHPDHFGYAGTLQNLTNAKVWMTEVDEIAGTNFWEAESLKRIRQNYDTCGIYDDTADILTENESSFAPQIQPYPVVNHYLEEGMKLLFGKYEYEVIYTPGHSDGLICLYNREQSILFSTDHILPKISPNISYWFQGIPNPLDAFFTSLKKVEKLEAEYVIPSHGSPFRNANKRIAELLSHHQDRLTETYQYLQRPVTIYEVCQKLFKKLPPHETRFAIGETLAHLEYLRLENQCQRFLENGVWYYEAV